MNIQQLRYIVEVAECGSISKASQKLYVTQPNISNSIKEIENEYGVYIFERGVSGMMLTADGNEFLKQIIPIVDRCDALSAFYDNNRKKELLFSVASHRFSFAQDVITDMITEYKINSYRICYIEGKTKDIFEKVSRGVSDVGLVIKRKNNKIMEADIKNSRLIFHPVVEVKPYVYIKRSNPLSKKVSLNDEDLKDYPYIEFSQGNDDMAYYAEEFVERKGVNKLIRVSDVYAMHEFVNKLDGYTIGSGLNAACGTKRQEGEITMIPYATNEKYEFGWLERDGEEEKSEFLKSFIERIEKKVKNNMAE